LADYCSTTAKHQISFASGEPAPFIASNAGSWLLSYMGIQRKHNGHAEAYKGRLFQACLILKREPL
jgi:hypothetical protein